MTEPLWVPIEAFPDYAVSEEGIVKKRDSGRIITHGYNQTGLVMVNLYREGQKYSRLVSLLVADAFIEPFPNPTFNSIIYLDGDKKNCHAMNLMRRPRWFAIRYHAQLNAPVKVQAPIYVVDTDEVYPDSRSLAMAYGLLETRIRLSLHDGDMCFPQNLELRYA